MLAAAPTQAAQAVVRETVALLQLQAAPYRQKIKLSCSRWRRLRRWQILWHSLPR